MKRFPWIAAILLVALAHCARADNVVYFNLTTINIDVLPNYEDDNVIFSLTGPGTNIAGAGGINCVFHWCDYWTTFSPGSVVFPQIGQIYLSNFSSAVLGGHSYSVDEIGLYSGFSVSVLGNVVLPVHPTGSYSVCVPATMSGAIGGVAGSGLDFIQFQLDTPTGGNFCTNWDYSLGQFKFDRGEFLVSTVPDPGTLGLTASGLLTLIGAALRRK